MEEEQSWGLDRHKIFLVILPAGPASEAFLNHPEMTDLQPGLCLFFHRATS